MNIGSENRAKLDAIAEDLTPSQYLDAIWRRRNKAYEQTRSTGKWPIKRATILRLRTV